MKKLFTLTAMFLTLSMSASAQSVRKTWDFRNGFSATTVANLNADMQQNGATGNTSNWRNWEKDQTKADDQAFWCADNGTTVNDDGYGVTTVDGQQTVIAELDGLNIKGIKSKGFVIAVNYNQAANDGNPSGMYPNGKSFIWLNGTGLTFSFSALKGDTLRMGIESHKNTEARGVAISVDGTEVPAVDGNAVPIFYNDVTWVLPDDTPGVDDYCTVTVKTTSGCHIYYIIAGKGDDPSASMKKVGYLFNGTTTGDFAYQTLTANTGLKVTPVDVASTTLTKDDLIAYDVTVVAPNVPADNANVSVLKDAMPWTPMLNFNGNLYEAWGYGRAATGSDVFGVTTLPTNQIFTGLTLVAGADAGLQDGQSGIVFTNSVPVTGVQLGDYFAKDDIIANLLNDSSAVAIHAHNIYHNGYLYLPYNTEALADANMEGDATATLINNAVMMLASSKADISNTPAPTFSLAYGNYQTTVTIEDARADAAIYYTTDGTEPTVASTRFVEPFTVMAQTQVKAIAVSEGYNPSMVSDSTIQVFEQAKAPTIAVEEADDQSIVTLASITADGQIWYNFSASTDTLQSTKYVEPIVLRDYKTVTAFVTSPTLVQSDAVTKTIYLKNDKVYIDIASHFDANYSADKSNGTGLFSWGKSAADSTITTDSIIGTFVDPDGIEQPLYYSYPREVELYPADLAAEWVVKSNGQSVLWQNLSVGTNPGDGTGYNPATAEDVDTLITKYDVQFYKFISGQYNARIESTKQFQGPFNVVTFLGNANGTGNVQRMGVEVSADGKNWTLVDDTITISNPQRLYSKKVIHYDGTDMVYVRLAQLSGNSGCQCYDIYVMTSGEKSAALEQDLADAYNQQAAGVEIVNTGRGVAKVKAIYSINGARINSLQRGINIVKMTDGTTRKVLVK
ncbi:MAG: chitobiase/beta-hexosaminidase C-terminal domain-containing protein [Prevotella sp.]|nr:chitobiase/beta-hexosaminidase C-terminal domain-containing protein [Prevotella sp.]